MNDEARSVKQPAIQFYPGDWRKDPAVTCLSLPAKAVWFEMILLMWESPERGYLRHKSGSQITPEQLARSVGGTVGEIKRCLSEMEDAGTFSRLEDGTIYNRRMIRDEKIRLIRKESGRLGGNPNLVNQTVKQNGKQKPTPSSSSSVSSSDIPPNPQPKPKIEFDEHWSEFFTEWTRSGFSRWSDADWSEARMVWKPLDFEQKLAAIQGLRARASAPEDSAKKSLPKNYIQKRMWERQVTSHPWADGYQHPGGLAR